MNAERGFLVFVGGRLDEPPARDELDPGWFEAEVATDRDGDGDGRAWVPRSGVSSIRSIASSMYFFKTDSRIPPEPVICLVAILWASFITCSSCSWFMCLSARGSAGRLVLLQGAGSERLRSAVLAFHTDCGSSSTTIPQSLQDARWVV